MIARLSCTLMLLLLSALASAEPHAATHSTDATTATLSLYDQITTPSVQRPAHPDDGKPVSTNFTALSKTRFDKKLNPVFDKNMAALDGKIVTIRGFMVPYLSLENLREFMLMRTSGGCFYCDPPAPEDAVLVRQKVKKAKYIDGPIQITGRLKLWKEDSPEKEHVMFIYIIDEAEVKSVE